MLSLLPVWHITERAFELWMASRGCTIVYSSIRTFKNDLAKHKPQWLVLVPRVLEKIANGVLEKFQSGSVVVKALSAFFTATSGTAAKYRKIAAGLVVGSTLPSTADILFAKLVVAALSPLNAVGNKLVWSKVQDGFGGQVKTVISGGSALSQSLETFYETAGIPILVGYGLTECSPLLSYRLSNANLVTAGCAGKPCHDTELRIVHADDVETHFKLPHDTQKQQPPLKSVPIGTPGVVLGRGPQVMQGYYKNSGATSESIDASGWFNTGDLGRINPATGDLILTGRAKDTIVLSNGENIEPVPIEDAIIGEVPFVEQCMLTGQDGRRLLAVVVLKPSSLTTKGYIDEATASSLTKAMDTINDPKCSQSDAEDASRVLNDPKLIPNLRQNSALKSEMLSAMKRATKSFRKWEQVGEVYVTLEPFAMVNGLLTQSYKVKRPAVLERYQSELPAE
jgi:long-chain acyl-CoA synthetase